MNRKQTYTRRLHEGRLKRLTEIELKPSYNGRGEAEVVPGFQLSAVLRRWTVEFLRSREDEISTGAKTTVGNVPKGGKWGKGQKSLTYIGPVQYLAQETGINDRRVSGICNGEFQFVPLSQADLLLQAIERPDLLNNEIQVVPNPNWSPERWLAYMEERGCV